MIILGKKINHKIEFSDLIPEDLKQLIDFIKGHKQAGREKSHTKFCINTRCKIDDAQFDYLYGVY